MHLRLIIPLLAAQFFFSTQVYGQKVIEKKISNILSYSYSRDAPIYAYFDMTINRLITVDSIKEDTVIHTNGIGGPFSQINSNGQLLASARNQTIKIHNLTVDSLIFTYHCSDSFKISKTQWYPNENKLIFVQGNANTSELRELTIYNNKTRLIKSFYFGDAFSDCNFSLNFEGTLIGIDTPEKEIWKTSILNLSGEKLYSCQGMFFGWANRKNSFYIVDNNESQNLELFKKDYENESVHEFIVNLPDYYAWFNQTYGAKTGFIALESTISVSKIDPLNGKEELYSKDNITFDSRSSYHPITSKPIVSRGIGKGVNVFSLYFDQNDKLELSGFMRYGGHAFQARLSPDGRSVLFQARSWHGTGKDSNGAYLINIETGAVELIQQSKSIELEADRIEWPAWLSNTEIVYTEWKSQWPERKVYKQDLQSNHRQLLINSEKYGIAHLEPSPNGSKIAFVKWFAGASDAQIMIYDLQKQNAIEKVKLESVSFSMYSQPMVELAWSEDDELFFVYNSNDTLKISKMNTISKAINTIKEIPDMLPFGIDYSDKIGEILLTYGSEPEINYYEISSTKMNEYNRH